MTRDLNRRSVPFYEIDSENRRLTNNRQEFGFEVFQASGLIMVGFPFTPSAL